MTQLSYLLPCILLLVTTSKCDDTEIYRLPKNVVPSHYVLQLVVNPEDTKFSGFAEITITAKNTTNDTLELHASPNHLTIKNNILLDYTLACNVTGSDNVTEIITITCPEDTLDGEHKLTIEFDGEISSKDKNGVFQSSYTENKKQEVLVSTNFEPVYARRAFPCFDEPSFKATFDVFITRPDVYKALSNTPEEDNFYVGVGQLQSKFATTPKMSTYLVAFVISKLDSTLDVPSDTNYTYSIYTRSSVKNNLDVASSYGSALVEKLSQWTAIPYQSLGDKQIDQVIIPDQDASDVENWGLITYSEADLLDEGSKTTQLTKQRIVTTMAHELAQQWFADYVTPDWWSDVWLDEGFATYFQYYISDMIVEENMELENQFVVNVLQKILQQDGPTSSPLSRNETDVNSASDDVNILDDITYHKGASIVRMIKGMTGETKFQDGVRMYLKKHRYNNTNVADLLNEISSGRFGSDFAIKTWLYQPGYPVLSAQYNSERSLVTLSQEPFDQGDNSTNSTHSWYIPVSYTTSDEKDFSIEMRDILVPGYRNTIEKVTNTSWIILNLQHHGYYRVNYDDWLWDKLIEALNNDDRKDIHVLNRAQLLDDIFALAATGRVSYQKVFELAEYLRLETDYYPWLSGLNALTIMRDKIESNETVDLLEDTIREWWSEAMERQKNESTSSLSPLKKAFFLEWSCKLNLNESISYATKTFASFKSSGRLSDYNERATIFCYGLRNSTSPVDDYKFLLDLYKTSTSADERNDIITGMGCSLDDTVLGMYLKETMANNSALRPEDVAAVYRSMYTAGDVGLMAALRFTFENAPAIVEKYEGMRVLTSILTGVAAKSRTQTQMQQLYKIIDYYSEIDDILICAWGLSTTGEEHRAFDKNYGKTINDILKKESPNDDSSSYIFQPSYIFTATLTLIVFYLN